MTRVMPSPSRQQGGALSLYTGLQMDAKDPLGELDHSKLPTRLIVLYVPKQHMRSQHGPTAWCTIFRHSISFGVLISRKNSTSEMAVPIQHIALVVTVTRSWSDRDERGVCAGKEISATSDHHRGHGCEGGGAW